MSVYNTTHRGGPIDNETVGTTAVIVLVADLRRRYAIITASRTNSDPIYLMLNNEFPKRGVKSGNIPTIGEFDSLPEVEKGIPLYPGDAYEIDEAHNLFQGHVLAISSAADQLVMTQEGY